MKAIVQDRYGSADDLELGEIDEPELHDGEVLIRVRAASVHPDIWHVLTGLPYVLRLMGAGLRRPKNRVPGTDMAGWVESVGKDVTRFRTGDEVFGETIRGHQWTNGGAFAEYVAAPEEALALKPTNVSFEQAAALPTSVLIALPALRGLQAGQRVLVNGAGGGVGTLTVQLAKAFGANVTGVDRTDKLEMIRGIGADQVIDYTQEDFTRGRERYDRIVDIPGNHSLSECRHALMPGGAYVLIGHDHYGKGMRRWVGLLPRMFILIAMSAFVKPLRGMRFSMPDKEPSMALLKKLLETGKLIPYIDRTFPLRDVPEAVRYLQEGNTKGKVVITV